MTAAPYALALAVVVTGIFASGARDIRTSNAAFASGLSATASPTPVASAEPTATASSAPSSTEPTASVDTKNFSYLPAELTVAAGSTVTFTNSDATAHTVSADDASFDSKNMAQGATWSHVFAKAGTYTYYCAYHRYMHGKIVVK